MKTHPHPPKRRHKPSHSVPPATHSTPVNPLKSKIRDVTRVLEHAVDLPAGVRVEKERELAGYRQDLDRALEEKRKQQMIKKYHMVRFFERQKASRTVKKLKKRLASASPGTPESTQLQLDLHAAEVDFNYAIYYPLSDKYHSIFPRNEADSKTQKAGSESISGMSLAINRPLMWEVVEHCMKEGTLKRLQDGKLATTLDIGAKHNLPAETPAPRRDQKAKIRNSSSKSKNQDPSLGQDQESDGGFFEE